MPEDAPSGSHFAGGPVAGLDLGTNNCRLLVAEAVANGREFRVIDSFSRSVRLGDGIEQSGALSQIAMNRTIEALKICAEKVERAKVSYFRAVATAACRLALNGGEFARRVEAETGVPLEIISAEEEARLAVSGCGPLVDSEAERVLIFDIGGGSTELVLLDLSDVAPENRAAVAQRADETGRHVVDWISVPVGVATLQDKFEEITDPARRFGLMTWYFEELIAGFGTAPAPGEREKRLQLIGASGSVTTIGSAHLGLRRYDRSKVDGLWVPVRSVRRIARELASLNDFTRAQHPSVGAERSKMIVASCAILTAILNFWPTQEIRVADRGLREGLIYAQIAPVRS